MNFWDFRSIVSIIEHDGLTLVRFRPGTSIENIKGKMLALGYARSEFDLLSGEDPELVDFRVFSDEEFPLYLCFSQIYKDYPFSAVTIQGEIFSHDVKDLEENGVELVDELVIAFVSRLGVDQAARILEMVSSTVHLETGLPDHEVLHLPVVKGRPMHGIVRKIDGIARIGHVHGTFRFMIDQPTAIE